MKSILRTLMFAALPLLLAPPSEASPKVTQAALCDFKSNQVTALAVEGFGKPLRLLFVGSGKTLVYSTAFIEGFNNHELLR